MEPCGFKAISNIILKNVSAVRKMSDSLGANSKKTNRMTPSMYTEKYLLVRNLQERDGA